MAMLRQNYVKVMVIINKLITIFDKVMIILNKLLAMLMQSNGRVMLGKVVAKTYLGSVSNLL
jgi:hypothetical protein